jgi:hypothetical protein
MADLGSTPSSSLVFSNTKNKMCWYCDSFSEEYKWDYKYFCSTDCAEHYRKGEIQRLERTAYELKVQLIVAKEAVVKAKNEAIRIISNTDK